MTNQDQGPMSLATAVELGTELNQTYKIDSLIGVGGMGEVFRGHNIQTGDPVAIKIVLPEYARDEMILELFRKEARILNHLSHDAIVRYYVFSIDRVLGRPYLAMEYVDGPSLAERIKSKPFSIKDVVFLQQRLADGLEKAHEAGVIHRDMSPDNVILPGGSVQKAKIIDFGIARSANVGGGTLLGGSFAGKYNFVSPEQLGLFGGEVTPQSDIYSLGLVLAAALRGRPLNMSGSQAEVVEKRRVVPDLSDIDPRIRTLLSAMLQPDPASRPPSMSAVRDWKPDKTEAPAANDATIVQSKKQKTPPAVSRTPSSIPPNAKAKKPASSGRWGGLLFGLLAIGVVAAGAFGGWYYVQTGINFEKEIAKKPEPAPDTKIDNKVPEKPAPTPPPAPTPSVDKETTTPPIQPETPPSVAPDTPPPVDRLKELAAFVANFDGGTCFFADPQAVYETGARIVGYGNKQEPFDRLIEAFKAKAGYEPDIQIRLVSDQQCDVIRVLKKLTVSGAAPPKLKLNKAILRMRNAQQGQKGDILEGTISGLGGRPAEVLLVDNEGGVQNIRRQCSTCVQSSGDILTIKITLNPPSETDAQTVVPSGYRPMLILALASPHPIKSISLRDAFPATDIFPQLAEEVASSNDTATAIEYFKLMNAGN